MKRKIMLLVTATICTMMCLTGCNSSDENAGSISNGIGNTAIEAVTEVEDVDTVEPTEAPAAEITEAPVEPTATPEPTLAPIEVTTEDGTMLPTEAIVYIKGSAVKLPCTVSEFMERTGEKIFKSDVQVGADYGKPGIATVTMPNYDIVCKTPKDAESYKDYIVYSISTSWSKCDGQACTDVTLHGDIYVGAECSSWDDLAAIYGTCDAPDANGNWWNIGDDIPEKEVDVFDCTWEEFQTLFMGYCVGFDDYEKIVTNVEVTISNDKLFELYGIR